MTLRDDPRRPADTPVAVTFVSPGSAVQTLGSLRAALCAPSPGARNTLILREPRPAQAQRAASGRHGGQDLNIGIWASRKSTLFVVSFSKCGACDKLSMDHSLARLWMLDSRVSRADTTGYVLFMSVLAGRGGARSRVVVTGVQPASAGGTPAADNSGAIECGALLISGHLMWLASVNVGTPRRVLGLDSVQWTASSGQPSTR